MNGIDNRSKRGSGPLGLVQGKKLYDMDVISDTVACSFYILCCHLA
jgi:hypothetical protein